jgi:hypothetical protein
MKRSQFVAVNVIALVMCGCSPKKQSTHVPQPNPSSREMSDVDARLDEMEKHSAELTAVTKELPGRDQAEDRKLLSDSFDRAASMLTLLMGPRPQGAFRQQLRIIDKVRQDIRAGSTSDATVDSGMRAVFNALVGIRERLFPADARVSAQLDTLRDRVADLDSVRGPLHRVAVADAFQSAAAVVETMRTELADRFAASQPASQPAQ